MDNKRILVVYYSRTGTTERIANEIAEALNCDIEKLYDLKKRNGIMGYIASGRDAVKRNLALINQIENDPTEYDLVIIGSPVWASTMSSAARTYIINGKTKFKNLAFFTTSGGPGNEKVFDEFRKMTGKKTVPYLNLCRRDIKSGEYKNKIKIFTDEIL